MRKPVVACAKDRFSGAQEGSTRGSEVAQKRAAGHQCKLVSCAG